MSTLTATVHPQPAGTVVRIAGELDYDTAGHLREVLRGITLRPGERLVLDLAGLKFCDSSGITTILAARNVALAAQADIALAAVPDSTSRVLRLVGLDQVLSIYPDSACAIQTP
jgi:anti-sigma B factor antagonist